ncbi:MAG: PQQ-binding-like beta-propeller repeat protein [Caulobacterales bacterium]
MRGFLLLALSLAFLSQGCGEAPTRFGDIDQARVLKADAEPQNWLTAGRDAGKTHYSPLAQINHGNVARLGFAWAFETGTNRALEATPIVVDGVMYASGPLGRVWALDARSGQQIWAFTPDVDGQINRKACCDQANRGVAVWRGKVYAAALDGVLYALDARTGAVLWRTDTIIDKTRGYTITGAPEIAKTNVVIGNAGDEYDVRGYLSAYDLDTGALAWRFFTVPDRAGKFEDPKLAFAEKTWSAKARHDLGGGGAPYDAILYDPTTNLIFAGTGNAGPYPRAVRDPGGGDNLFVCSILALDADTGKLVWHHQQTPADQWDFTATQPMILADLRIAGKKRSVLMQAPKNGFFYVYDRRSGEVLAADKYARVNWADHVDLKTGRPVETATADYSKTPKLVSPAMYGAHNWNPMAFSAKTGLFYIPAIDGAAILWTPGGAHRHRPGLFNPGAVPFLADQIKHEPQSLPQQVRAALPAIVRDADDLHQKA